MPLLSHASKSVFSSEEDGVRIEDQLQLFHLEELKRSFDSHVPPKERIFNVDHPHIKKYRQPGHLNIKEFKEMLSKVLVDAAKYEEQLERLFLKLDSNSQGLVNWNEFCTYLMTYFKENDRLNNRIELPFRSDPRIRNVIFNRQEPTARILLTENPIRPISVTKTGTILLWDCSLKLEGHLQTQDAPPDLSTSSQQRRRFHEWVMDAVYMPNCHKLAFSTSAREIKFFDVASNVIKEEFVLFGLKFVPLVLKYYFSRDSSESLLFFGDDGGNISCLDFQKPVHQLFDLPPDPNHHSQRVWICDILSHESCVRYQHFEAVHSAPVNNLAYIPDNRSLISCSTAPNNSVIIYDLQRQRPLYIFKNRRGFECFDLCKALDLLVTGSSDHLVRMWNPYVPSKAISILEGHNNPILSVQIHQKLNAVFSYSREGVTKVWDVKTYECLQTVTLRLPFMLNSDKTPDYLNNPFFLHTPSNSVYLSASDYIIQYRIGKPVEPIPGLTMTHREQLCGALYNPFFSQVTTAADDSDVITWDLETGNKCLVIANAHEGEEITCLSYGASWRRLFTGSRNGKTKAWNLQTGAHIHLLEAVGESEVTGIVMIPLQKKILTVGWNKKVIIYKDRDDESFRMAADDTWKGGIAHKDDILASDFCSPELLATASYDGEILVWNIDFEKVAVRLREGYCEKIEKVVCQAQGITPPASRSSVRSRPNSRHRSQYKTPARSPAPVDKLVFLKKRAADRRFRESAILVSSDAGHIRFWSVHGRNHLLAAFYGAVEPNECILGLCTNDNNSIFLMGDTSGYVRGWNVTNYAIFQAPECDSKPPAQLTEFRAHEAALVSVDIAELEYGTFVITASVDCTAKLYTFGGEIIGTFGQAKPWDIHNRKTWKQTQIDRQNLFDSLEDKGLPRFLVRWRYADANEENTEDGPFVTRVSREGSSIPEEDAASIAEPSLVVRAQTMPSLHHPVPAELPVHTRLIGIKAEKDFERMRLSRYERRSGFGAVKSSRAVPPGTICSPFSALKTADMAAISMPESLPLPPSWTLQKYKTTIGKFNSRSALKTSASGDPGESRPSSKNARQEKTSLTFRAPSRLPPIADSD